jgi:hypothetical protein
MLHWAVGQVSKERAIACWGSRHLCLHLSKGFRIICAVIPMNETMEICQIADIEALPYNLSPGKERHLVMAA